MSSDTQESDAARNTPLTIDALAESPQTKGASMRRIYLASSWKNDAHRDVVLAFRAAGHEVYDFKEPVPGDNGFHWSEVARDVPSSRHGSNEYRDWTFEDFRTALDHPASLAGFTSDFSAMEWADTCVLLLPCGRSAHLELGWFVGQERPTCILRDPLEGQPYHHFQTTSGPELMYRMVDVLASTTEDAVEWLSTLGVDAHV